jgi:hypothetical protein
MKFHGSGTDGNAVSVIKGVRFVFSQSGPIYYSAVGGCKIGNYEITVFRADHCMAAADIRIREADGVVRGPAQKSLSGQAESLPLVFAFDYFDVCHGCLIYRNIEKSPLPSGKMLFIDEFPPTGNYGKCFYPMSLAKLP